jgi:DNA-binding beta-propeller fold protein YncE
VTSLWLTVVVSAAAAAPSLPRLWRGTDSARPLLGLGVLANVSLGVAVLSAAADVVDVLYAAWLTALTAVSFGVEVAGRRYRARGTQPVDRPMRTVRPSRSSLWLAAIGGCVVGMMGVLGISAAVIVVPPPGMSGVQPAGAERVNVAPPGPGLTEGGDAAGGDATAGDDTPMAGPAVPPRASAPGAPGVSIDFLSVADAPGYIAVTSDATRAWIAHRDSDLVSVLDLATMRVVHELPINAGRPHFVAFCPDGTSGGRKAYVSVHDAVLAEQGRPDSPLHAIVVIDTVAFTEVARIDIGSRPAAAACAPDGRTLVVPSPDDARFAIIDTATDTLRTVALTLPGPSEAAYSADGRTVWAAVPGSQAIVRLDPISLSQQVTMTSGMSPRGVAVRPDGVVAMVGDDSSELRLIGPAAAATINALPVARSSQDVAWTTDGRWALTVDVENHQLAIVDVDGRTPVALVALASDRRPAPSPTSVVALADGRVLVTLLNSSEIAVITP